MPGTGVRDMPVGGIAGAINKTSGGPLLLMTMMHNNAHKVDNKKAKLCS